MENYTDLINELNDHLYKIGGDQICDSFSYQTNGYVDLIMFNNEILWCSEDSTREWLEEENCYEPFLPFIKNLFNNYIDNIHKYKF